MDCLVAAVSAAPAAFRAHLKPLEDYTASALVDHGSSIPARQRAAHLLSLLPSITGAPTRPRSDVLLDLIVNEGVSWHSSMQYMTPEDMLGKLTVIVMQSAKAHMLTE